MKVVQLSAEAQAKIADEAAQRECTLAALRAASCRLKEIDAVVTCYGLALKCGLIDAKRARELVEQVAPGVIDTVALDILDEVGK